MSHFTVLVIGQDYETQLAPYQENNMGDCPQEYLAFVDLEDEYRTEYETESTERVVMPDGRLLSKHDDEFRVNKQGSSSFSSFSSSSHAVPEDLEVRRMPFKEIYATLEDFAQQYHGHSERDPKTNRFGYWENPNRKWDWYELGGRWTGFFKLKEGAEGKAGSPGLLTARAKSGYADAVRWGDVDLQAMRDEAATEAGARFDEFHRIVAGRPLMPYPQVLAKHNDDATAARDEYWGQPALRDLQAARMSWGIENFLNISREEYVDRARASTLQVHAVLHNGQWYERGSMGWWGCVADAKDEGAWLREINSLLEGLSPDTELHLVDCHI